MKQITLSPGELPLVTDFRPGLFESARAGARATLRLWRQRSQQRRHLARLGAHELDDIGITEAERLAESTKPFWRA